MMMRRRLLAGAAALLAVAAAALPGEAAVKKKRLAPEPVEPVSFEGRRYEALVFGKARGLGQNGGHVVAIDEATGRELWVQRIYRIRYDRGLEADKQDVFITGLTLLPSAHALEIENERGARYRLDLRTRQVAPR
jgi:hypothetical protein